MFSLDRESIILVTCPKGLAPFTAAEMQSLGFEVDEQDAGVRTKGGLAECMRLNLHLRCGHRVLYRLKRFGAMHPDMVYRETNAMPWEEIFSVDGYVSVDSFVSHPTIRDGRFANVRVKDGVADRFSSKLGKRPDSGPDKNRGVCLFLYWRGKKAELFLDTSGVPLPKRGYRQHPFRAPMQETLAAAVISALEWDPDTHFVNPMCGSGTPAIEAALSARRIAPGLLRENFSFMHVNAFDPAAWQKLCEEARADSLPKAPGRIIASDINEEAVEAARMNVAAAGLGDDVELSVCDFRETEIPGGGALLFNPEYGERLGDKGELGETYAGIGDFLKHKCPGMRAGVFTADKDLAKRIGLKAMAKVPFFSAKLACTLFVYELWTGSLRNKA
jgi:putative N6-adenine-specific DNA methylase